MELQVKFDYQSDRHCAKTGSAGVFRLLGLITSQIDTAPKLARDADAAVSV